MLRMNNTISSWRTEQHNSDGGGMLLCFVCPLFLMRGRPLEMSLAKAVENAPGKFSLFLQGAQRTPLHTASGGSKNDHVESGHPGDPWLTS